ncbi:glycosyltransferase family 9 protein [Micromonospora sagamiensis]|uniref:ADP-heptose:LPS heptosyltransferase n=1 Tax=Micromonospora sagamiensis TaxID=47875 RepID=A0A562WJS4_9ACTN|nr:glycosyltransferase family 9 protein [Micromonospora sagamiensis]TWJ30137.1 ADP-heptose:LPS heptosyltransferase [Micromonospora sagamiensis]BCL16833.1 glycosyl transferase [Micromonospora sagamiensis]
MILVLRALGVGDLATAVPALRALRAGFPDRELVLAAPDWLSPLVDLVGGVDRVLPVTGLAPPDRPGPSPGIAVNLHGRGPQSHALLLAADPGRLFAFRCPSAGHPDGPEWDDTEHEVRRWCRLLDWYGLPAEPGDLALARPAPDRAPVGVTVLHPGTKVPAKRWSPARFAAVARHLARTGHRVVVTGSPTERAVAEQVARRAGLPPTAVLAGRTGLTDLAALVAHARLVVSGDTGVAHLATGYGTPSVVLFGPVPPTRWGPPPDRPRHRVLWAGTGSDPRWDGVGMHPTMAVLSVDQVLAEVDEAERAVRDDGAVAA